MLKWAAISQGEMKGFADSGRMDEVERTFSSLLAWCSSIHEALEAAAGKMGAFEWRTELEHLRATDPLLWYMWKCRDLHVHGQLFQWDAMSFGVKIWTVDREKNNQFFGADGKFDDSAFFRFLWEVNTAAEQIEKMAQGFRPSEERKAAAGVQMDDFSRSLNLNNIQVRIKGKYVEIPSPTQHLGKFIAPNAMDALTTTLVFYRRKLEEISVVLAAAAA